jgi:PBP1b-binding outer membrane lipoprotein LpoB
MNAKILLVLLASLIMLNGCASTEEMQRAQVKRITPEELAKLVPAPIATYTLETLVADTKQGATADVIIQKIKDSESRYDLTTAQVLDLSQQGVDVKVIEYIQQSNELAKQNYLAEEINRAEKEKAEAIRRLNNERLFRTYNYYDPFWNSRFGPFFGHPYYPRSRFRWGLGYGW